MEQYLPRPEGISRRGFIALAGALALAGCGGPGGPGRPGVPEASAPSPNARELLARRLFFIAHRGSGDNWTEHTLHAYRQAVAHGAPAVEISVHRTLDGHFVCHHDTTLQRLCGVPARIDELTLEKLSGYRNDARAWLGPDTPTEPIPALDEVLGELGGRAVLFIEDKTGQHGAELIERLKRSGTPAESIVWKQSATGAAHRQAAEHGYATWGYFAPADFGRISELAGQFDAIGIHDSAGEHVIRAAVATGKPVICWEVHTRSREQALQEQSVAGMMCSNYPYASSAPGTEAVLADDFASGRRAAGDLPDVLVWKAQPRLLPDEGALRLSGRRKAGYVLGSMASTTAGPWSLEAQLRWPVLGQANQVAGIAFALPDDTPYRGHEAGQRAGFHLQVETGGQVSLWQAREGSPVLLHRTGMPRPAANRWLPVRLDVSAGMLRGTVGAAGFSVPLQGADAPGYLNLLTLIPGGQPVDFRSIELRRQHHGTGQATAARHGG